MDLSKIKEDLLKAKNAADEKAAFDTLSELFKKMVADLKEAEKERFFGGLLNEFFALKDKLKRKHYYLELLYMFAFSFYVQGYLDNAEKCATEHLKLAAAKQDTKLLLAKIFRFNGDAAKLRLAQKYVEEYLAVGDPAEGLPIKVELHTRLNEYHQASALLAECAPKYPEKADRWNILLMQLYDWSEDYPKFFETGLELIKAEPDREKRMAYYDYGYNVACFKGEGRALSFIRSYLELYPNESFALINLSQQSEDIDECIDAAQKAFAQDEGDASILMQLTNCYLKRGGEGDIENYFAALNKLMEKDIDECWQFAHDLVYDEIGKHDSGQAINILTRATKASPDHDCYFTLLGKAYECGVGCEPNPKRARELYKEAYEVVKGPCKCGMLFYSYALMYGIGGKADRVGGRDLLLRVGRERGEDDCEYACLFAVAAFEDNDRRFSQKKAITLLNKEGDSACCAFLLFKYAKNDELKNAFWRKFVKLANKADYIEREHLKKYLENPQLEFVPFIHN